MKMFLLATSALLIASATPAFAQDSTDGATAAPMTSSADGATFAGPRGEVFGGWNRGGSRARFDDGTTRITSRDHDTAWTGGGLLGYDVPIGDTLTVGGFGSYAISTAKTCDAVGAGTVGCLKAGREIEGGGRVGYKLGGRALVYGKGAYVNSQLRGQVIDANGGIDTGHKNLDGWRAGAGVELAINKHAYVKAEYDYTRFKSIHGDDLGETDPTRRPDRNQVLGGFGIHF